MKLLHGTQELLATIGFLLPIRMLTPKMQGMINRQITEKLQATLAQVAAVTLLGACQAGKTTLAKTIARAC